MEADMIPARATVLALVLIAFTVAGCAPQATPSPIEAPAQETPTAPSPPSTPSPEPSSTVAPTAAQSEPPVNTLFDDFDYAAQEEMTANGWIIRAEAGWPGVSGATFRPENVSFSTDPEIPTNNLLSMTSSTDGSSANTFQTQICHQRKYLEGTYAARVRFTNTPTAGPDGDQVVETFYAITPYEEAFDPAYSEMDFEYLPNGAWGLPPTAFAFTTWETVRIEPWLADNASNQQVQDMEGWRTLVVQVGDGKVRYYVGGTLTAEHGGDYYPDSPMSINFNLWFVNDGLVDSAEVRSYVEDVDWVFHEAGVILTPQQVNRKVQELRDQGFEFVDSVPVTSPPLTSPCDL
jgi:hypothetical protein